MDFAYYLRTILGIVRRNALLFSIVVAIAVVLGIVATLLMTPRYEAQTRVLIEDQADQIIEGSDLQQVGAGWDTERFLQTQLGILQSRSVARKVVQSGRFDKDPAFFEAMGSAIPEAEDAKGIKLEDLRRERAIGLLSKAMQVELPRDSRIATITVETRNPELTARIANLYADRFVEYNLERKYESSAYARKFLADQLDEARRNVTQSEKELNQFARVAGLIRLGNESRAQNSETTLSVTNDTLVQLNGAAATATAERIAAQDRWETFRNQPALSIPEVNSNSAIMDLTTEKSKAEGQLAELLATHRDDYPTVRSKRAEIAELDNRIQRIATALKNSARLDFQAAQKKEQSLVGRVDNLREDALEEQDRGVQYSVLKRVADTNRALYESLLSRYNQLSASAGSASNNVTIVDRADVPRAPSSPNLLINLVLAFLGGIVAAAIAVAAREILDDAVRSPEDVERKLGLTLLGLIPRVKGGDVGQELGDGRSGVSEAYSSLVTNLRYSTARGLPHVLAVTSSRQGEGKTTTSQVLAGDIAKLGKRVLLVDADLRRPTLHRELNGRGKSGLTDVLTGEASLEQAIVRSDAIPTLDNLTALPLPPDPALILGSERLTEFVQTVRTQYDVVVLDCPPLLGLADAPLLTKHADAVLFVIDGSSFHRGAVKSALRRLALVNAKVLGVVLNRFSPKTGDQDYSYYSYSYYNYGKDD